MQIVIQLKVGLDYNIMTKGILVLFTVIQFSCGNKNFVQSSKNVKIYNTYSLGEYTFFEGVKEKDSIVFLIASDFLKSCNKKVRFVNNESLKQISNLKIKNDTIYFCYSIYEINKKIKIKTSENLPNGKKHIFVNTYSKYPFFIDNCEAIK